MKLAISIISVTLVLFGSVALAQGPTASEGLTESFHVVRLSRGGDLNLFVSKRTGSNPTVGVLLFAGYPGILKIKSESGAVTYDLAGNFLIRARRFLNSDKVFTVMVDCPVDQWTSCDDDYRTSSQHVADIADVVGAVKTTLGAQQVYIVGTSYGTVSTSFLARNLGDKIEGAIHTATFTDPRTGRQAHGVAMRNFDWSRAKLPQLFVHHKDDPCDVTRYSSIAERRKDIPLVTVEGATNPRGDACQAFTAHGFVGRERAVMTAIHEWITVRKLEPVVGKSE
jgi:hypothetical protein